MAWLCLNCRAEITPQPNLSACPSCSSTGIPADTELTQTITLTDLELKLLVVWAEFWANHHHGSDPSMLKVVYGVADGIQPQLTRPLSLTLRGEIADLQAHLGEDNIEVRGFNIDPI